MLLTEDEAKTKWCPKALSGIKFAANRGADGRIYEQDCCVASGCMMWRWEVIDDYTQLDRCTPVKRQTDRGYCGIGGKVKNQPPDLTAGEFNRGE